MDRWIVIKAVPFAAGIVAALWLVRRSRAAGASLRTSAGGALLLFSSIVLVYLMAVHTLAIPLFRYLEPARVQPAAGRSIMIGRIRYDYRLYSLMLMGIVMLRLAVQALRNSAGVARGEESCRRRAWKAVGAMALMTAPVIPLSFEAWLYGATLLLSAASLGIAKAKVEPNFARRGQAKTPVLL